MPNGRVAAPPAVTSSGISAGCVGAPYGPNFYAPGSGKTVALTFDDGPGPSTAGDPLGAADLRRARHLLQHRRERRRQAQPGATEASPGYLVGNHTWNHPNLPPLSGVRAGRPDGRRDRRARGPHRLRAMRVPPAVRRLQLHHPRPRAAAGDEGVAVVGGHRGLEGRRSASSYWVNRIIHAGRAGGRQRCTTPWC